MTDRDDVEALAQRLLDYAEADDLLPQERKDLFEAARRLAARQSPPPDNPECDGTPNAHPAYSRGEAAGVNGACMWITAALDGRDDGVGVFASPALEALRWRVLSAPVERIKAVETTLRDIAQLAHSSGLIGLDTFSALNVIRKLTQRHVDLSGAPRQQEERVRAAHRRAASPQPAGAMVPDAMPVPKKEDGAWGAEISFAKGWNAYRDAMLAAAPKAGDGKGGA